MGTLVDFDRIIHSVVGRASVLLRGSQEAFLQLMEETASSCCLLVTSLSDGAADVACAFSRCFSRTLTKPARFAGSGRRASATGDGIASRGAAAPLSGSATLPSCTKLDTHNAATAAATNTWELSQAALLHEMRRTWGER
jgi:hypothetical protein